MKNNGTILKPFDSVDVEAPDREKLDYNFLLKKHLVNIKKPIKRQPVAISIGEHPYLQNSYPTVFGSYGDFSCLVGASKSMKTFLKCALVACYIGGNSNRYFSEIKGHDTTGKYILDIDTEQSPYHTQRAAKRIMAMVGSDYEFYKPFSLREMNAKTRLEFIDWLVRESEYSGNIGLMSIDGAADLMDNVNDLEAANKITQYFMEWTANQNCHLITILHRNFGGAKPTGHLGSSILKKAETVAFVERKDGISRITPEYTRNSPFEAFALSIDSNGLPMEVGNGGLL